MKNEQEINNQMEILKSLDKELDKYEAKVDELIKTKDLEEVLKNCQPKKRAEVYWTAAFGIYTNKYLDLLLNEKDPELHSIKKEINRLDEFRQKLINADKKEEKNEEINNKNINKKKKKENIYQKIKQLNDGNLSNNI